MNTSSQDLSRETTKRRHSIGEAQSAQDMPQQPLPRKPQLMNDIESGLAQEAQETAQRNEHNWRLTAKKGEPGYVEFMDYMGPSAAQEFLKKSQTAQRNEHNRPVRITPKRRHPDDLGFPPPCYATIWISRGGKAAQRSHSQLNELSLTKR